VACATDATAACWDQTDRLSTFAAATGTWASGATLDVRLAHRDGALLVRAAGLPEGAVVELVVAGAKNPAETNDVLRVSEGVSRHALRVPVRPGDERIVRAHLLRADGAVLVWSGPGPALLGGSPPVAFRERVAKHAPPRVAEEGGRVVVEADGAEITVQALDLDLPSTGQTPWSVTSIDRLAAEAPGAGGWADVVLRWPDGLDAYRVYLSPAPAGEVVLGHGIHPAPRVARSSGAHFELGSDARVVYRSDAYEHAARLLAEGVTCSSDR
jgi:hypothetical protein